MCLEKINFFKCIHSLDNEVLAKTQIPCDFNQAFQLIQGLELTGVLGQFNLELIK